MKNLDQHLRKYIVDTSDRVYNPQEHAVWRYTLRQLKSFLSQNAHSSYVDGLKKTGITLEEIPKIESISQRLSHSGWTAKPVSGFIPPAVFMEMQAANILPIASDMRSIDQILYTPAPDIVHEAAGHAPMLACQEYSEYLKKYAAIAKKAIISREDMEIYKAIRKLSDLKSQTDVTQEEIKAVQNHLDHISSNITYLSEAALLSRMNWWTAEYGLIGTLDDPKIFGAGLLSSVGEAKHCLSSKVKKLPLTIDCINYSYDITEQQPQLFVTPSFAHLGVVLDELANQMAFKTGGLAGLEKAAKSQATCTAELNSGLQISGHIVEYVRDSFSQVGFIKFSGPCQLSFGGQQLTNHSKEYHASGYSSPLGFLKAFPKKCPSTLTDKEWQQIQVDLNHKSKIKLEYTNGVVITGELHSSLKEGSQTLLLSLDQAHATFEGRDLYLPEWGRFDLALGTQVTSVFGGPADRIAYGEFEQFEISRIPKRKYSQKDYKIFGYYEILKDLRHGKKTPYDLETCVRLAIEELPHEWLIFIESLEIARASGFKNIEEVCLQHLNTLENQPDVKTCVRDGIALSHLMEV